MVTQTLPVAKDEKALAPLNGRRLFWVRAWRRFRRNRLAIFGVIFAVLIILVALFAPVLAPYPYDRINPREGLQPPSAQHVMGTDLLGRDMLSRIMYGAQPMLLVGILTGVLGLIVGVPAGLISGYAGGAFDWIISRFVDIFSALPWYLVVLYMVMVLSPSLQNLIIALSITGWVGSCRLVRGMTFSIREQNYIDASRALGMGDWQLIARHILPQIAPLLLWGFAAYVPTAVFAEAGLSFIGLGVRPPQPSWGQMLAEAGNYWQYFPHMFIFPSLMITLSVLSFQGMADGLRDAMDVRMRA